MDMINWEDSFLLDGSWAMDLPFHQENGLFGDLKEEGHVEDNISFQAQDAVQLSPLSEDGLATDWMETPDLLAQFDLGSYDPKLVVVDSSLDGLNTFITPTEAAAEVELDTCDVKPLQTGTTTFDALITPPGSPAQVAPVIQLQQHQQQQVPIITETSITSPTDLVTTDITASLLQEIDFSSVSHVDEESFIYLGGACDLINSPLSADDVDSMLSQPSTPTSPSDDKSSHIIESSPELYKVISTSSLEASARFSPYQKVKPKKKEPKLLPKKRAPAQPVPEHVILEQVNKKDRKKLQNKNAAIRYRQKKKEEANGIKGEEHELEEYNSKLKTKVEDLEREIRYMKNLMEDVCRAKGLM